MDEKVIIEVQKGGMTDKLDQMTAYWIKELTWELANHEDNLRGWQEPDGYLVPTEPDPEERARVREGCKGAIHATKRAIAIISPDIKWE